MKNSKRCGGAENRPDGQDSRTTAVMTEDGCENVHIDMGTGQITYTKAADGACALNEKENTEKK